VKRFPVLVVLCALVLGCTSGGARGNEQASLRVLFVGNSLTATNDLPATVAAIARRESRTIETRMVAPGGVNLEDHWTLTGARDALADGRWDAVVLQQGPSALPESQANLKEWAQRWADEIRAAGARPALLTVWPESYRKTYAFGEVIRSYANAATAAHAELFPAGVAWRAAWRRSPRLPLTARTGSTRRRWGRISPPSSSIAASPGRSRSSAPRRWRRRACCVPPRPKRSHSVNGRRRAARPS
jgi:hypothetical protein